METFSSATELLKLVAHINQLAELLNFGSLSDANRAVHKAELNRLKEILALVQL